MKFFPSPRLITLAILIAIGFPASPSSADEIWSPSRVDWWVSAGDELDSACQIHWLFDDRIDVSFRKNEQGFYFYRIDDSEAESAQISQDLGPFEGSLIVGDQEIFMGVQKVTNSKFVATVSPDFNNLTYLRDAKVVLLKSDKILYNFPLENGNENFEVYEQCLKDNNQDQGQSLSMPALDQPQMPVSILDVEAEALDTVVGDASQNNASNPMEQMVVTLEESEVSSPLAVMKQGDNLQSDLVALDDFKDGKSVRAEKKIEAPKSKDYGSKSTLIIRNLTKKLAVLEKEKESLRLRLLSTDNVPVISDIMACPIQEPEIIEESGLSDVIISEFEDIIADLKAENELLNAAVVDKVPGMPSIENAADTVALKENIENLTQTINELQLENVEMKTTLKNYQTMVGEAKDDDELSDSKIEDVIEEAQDYDLDAAMNMLDAEISAEAESESLSNSGGIADSIE